MNKSNENQMSGVRPHQSAGLRQLRATLDIHYVTLRYVTLRYVTLRSALALYLRNALRLRRVTV